MWLLSNLLTGFIRTGTLRVIDSLGRSHTFGGVAPGPAVTLRLHDRGTTTTFRSKSTGCFWMSG
jgi:cyclopropane-fatty-acyl-phospholipid synthase